MLLFWRHSVSPGWPIDTRLAHFVPRRTATICQQQVQNLLRILELNPGDLDLEGAPFRRKLTEGEPDFPVATETEFEKARGVNRIEMRTGLAGVLISQLKNPVAESRLEVLEAVFESQTNIDFLKLTPDGMTFVCPESATEKLVYALTSAGVTHEIRSGRSVLSVHAVNMRDEEGLVAKIVSEVIASGAQIEHLGDMHDRVLILMPSNQAEAAASHLKALYPEAIS
ncbi:hypothetical protein QPK87_14005 [Kamptonema cortianum]|nr:hypothetical protein [Geitlerinema splendidum]MDK3157682.1 hypothetical protein [Kamptonema cortianum]